VTKGIASLWNTGKNWTPFKKFMSTGSPIAVNEEFVLQDIDFSQEEEFEKEVVFGSKILLD
jgi:hypothetical protein